MDFKDRIEQVIADGVNQVQNEQEANETFRKQWPETQGEIRAVFEEAKHGLYRQFGRPQDASEGEGWDEARLEVRASVNDVAKRQSDEGAASTMYSLTFKAEPRNRAVRCTARPADLLEEIRPAFLGQDPEALKPGDIDRKALEDLVERFVKAIMDRLARQAVR